MRMFLFSLQVEKSGTRCKKLKISRINAIIRKELARMLKEPAYLFLIVIFPLVLTIAFGFSFGGFFTSEEVYTVAVINNDSESIYPEWSGYFISNLSKNDILDIKLEYDEIAASNSLQNGDISSILIIPEQFGESIETYFLNPVNPELWINISIEARYDAGSLVVAQLLPPLFQEALMDTLFGPDTTSIETPFTFGEELVEARKTSMFDFMVPGLFAFANIFLIMTIAEGFAKEKELKLLTRMRLTPVKSSELMLGMTISNFVAAVAQNIIVFAIAFAMGYRPLTGIGGILMALLTLLVFALGCIGCGLISGAISKSSGMATGISFVFILPLMFLGTFVTFGAPTIFNKLMPSHYVTESLTSIFLRGANPWSTQILVNLGIVTGFSIGFFVIGVLLIEFTKSKNNL